MKPAAVIVVAYLFGSIPFGYMIVRASQGTDVRETGSGGTGATNVSRRAGKAAGVFTLLLDALKGSVAVGMASWILNVPLWGLHYVPQLKFFANSRLTFQDAYWCIAGAAVAVIVGHMFPIWLGFRGGKGVATGVGVFLLLAPTAVAFAGLLFVLTVWITRYVSLGSILAAVAMPLFIWLGNFIFGGPEFIPLAIGSIVIALLVLFAHRGNIRRLISGTESKFH